MERDGGGQVCKCIYKLHLPLMLHQSLPHPWRTIALQLGFLWRSAKSGSSILNGVVFVFLHARNSYTYDLPNSAGVEITNLFVSPGKSDLWNASLQVI
mmetsp:Transcript_70390/g.114352  ORF Transcript_70390/g.114352 Transcript_70390/m.114352 type:complete len:98 (+) Transcript_70390:548-841(+)